MSQHSQDGRVWAVQKSDGRKVRVHPSFLASFPENFRDVPSKREKTPVVPTVEPKSTHNQKEA